MSYKMTSGSALRQSDPAGLTPTTSVLVNRWAVLDKIKALRAELNLNDRDITVLHAHLSILPKGPVNTGSLNMSYMKLKDIHQRAMGMEEKAFRRSEVRLEQAGIIKRRLSGNGRRFPIYRDNKIVDAHGVDLAPLFAMSVKLDAMIEQKQSDEQERRALKTSIQCQLQDLRRSFEFTCSSALQTIVSFIDSIRNVLRRKSTGIHTLQEIAGQVDNLGSDLAQDADKPTLETPVPSDKTPVDDARIVRHIESPKKEFIKKGFLEHRFDQNRIREIWSKAPALSEFYPLAPACERDLAEVLFEYSSFLGLKKDMVLASAAVLGWERLCLCLDYMTSRLAQIKSPNGYLKSMLKSYESGQSIAQGQVSRYTDPLSGLRLSE